MIVGILLAAVQVASDPDIAVVERFVAAVQAGQLEQANEALGQGQIRKVEPVYKTARGRTFPGIKSRIEDLSEYVKPCTSYSVKRGTFATSEQLRDFTVRWACGEETRYGAMVATRDGHIVKVFWGALGYAGVPDGRTFLPAIMPREQGKKTNG
ncbi:MAG: hypothetical protein EOO83_01345 [Oxalobacteraceae bacterium]|nr:MAG: hypothetical protein EOO83_01345 [Oxalobacteraceae bacterium]